MVHGDDIIYIRIDWENHPSDKTPVNERNLNKMDLAIHLLDERVVWLNGNKFDKIEAFKLIKDIDLNEDTGIFTITYYDDRKKQFDTILEKVATNWDYDSVHQQLVITLDDGTVKMVDLSALITQYEFMTSDTVSFEVQPDGKVKAIVREGSIQEKHLRPDYLADIRLEQGKAQQSAADAEWYAKLSESYAHGGTGVREGEGSDNAMEYARQAKESADRAEEIISQGDTSEIVTIEKSLSPGVDWIDTGIHKGDLKTGSYVVTLFVNSTEYGAMRETYVGIMHWYSDSTYSLSDESNEILLHSSGYRQVPERRFFLRTKMQGSYGFVLEIASSRNPNLEKVLNLVFTFKKIL